jgi:Arc/MetJ-type ribon-helix-helix transcriptional regulator
VRTARAKVPTTYFLGVRLTTEEESLLERFRRERDLANRSEAVRALVRGATPGVPTSVELPATLRSELEELVEDGYANDLDGAVTLVLHHGLRELARLHDEVVPTLRSRAKSVDSRRAERQRAEREGRKFLQG